MLCNMMLRPFLLSQVAHCLMDEHSMLKLVLAISYMHVALTNEPISVFPG